MPFHPTWPRIVRLTIEDNKYNEEFSELDDTRAGHSIWILVVRKIYFAEIDKVKYFMKKEKHLSLQLELYN